MSPSETVAESVATIDLKRLAVPSPGGAEQQTERLSVQRSGTEHKICVANTEYLDNPTFCPHRNSAGVDMEAFRHKGKMTVMD